jgi:hypothetical protein
MHRLPVVEGIDVFPSVFELGRPLGGDATSPGRTGFILVRQ